MNESELEELLESSQIIDLTKICEWYIIWKEGKFKGNPEKDYRFHCDTCDGFDFECESYIRTLRYKDGTNQS